jgi:hypothetical protein
MVITPKLKQSKTGYYLKKNFMKKCNRCKKNLDWDKFRKDRRKVDGYYGYCLKCSKEKNDIYKNKIKEGTIKAF